MNRDGQPEITTTGAAPPGEPDRVTVLSWRDQRFVRVFSRAFSGGVVAVTVADIDGDGIDNVVAAVRLPGSYRVDLWTLNG